MSRSMSWVGLPPGADTILHDKDKTETCPLCGTEKTILHFEAVPYEFSEQFYDDGNHLYEYSANGQLQYREEIQEVPWSSGPVVFVKLVDKDGNDVLTWSEEEMNSYI